MNNNEFLSVLKDAFAKFLSTGSRSNQKLLILHHKVATDILSLLGSDYCVKSLGVGEGKEATLTGRYFDKKVDITFFKKEGDKEIAIAGLGVKMVMQNYAQNSNNYFENMMGETANLRSNNMPYFQLFAIPDKLPYYNDKKVITKWEGFAKHHAEKYLKMSQDNTDSFMHTPTKTLVFAYHIPDADKPLTTKREYIEYYSKNIANLELSESPIKYGHLGNTVIFNNYENFIKKVAHYILSI